MCRCLLTATTVAVVVIVSAARVERELELARNHGVPRIDSGCTPTTHTTIITTSEEDGGIGGPSETGDPVGMTEVSGKKLELGRRTKKERVSENVRKLEGTEQAGE